MLLLVVGCGQSSGPAPEAGSTTGTTNLPAEVPTLGPAATSESAASSDTVETTSTETPADGGEQLPMATEPVVLHVPGMS